MSHFQFSTFPAAAFLIPIIFISIFLLITFLFSIPHTTMMMMTVMCGLNPKPLLHLSLLLLLLLFSSPKIESLRFELQSGHTKCISEDIKSNSMTVGKYSVVNPSEGHPLPDSHRFTVRVIFSSPLHQKNPNFLVPSIESLWFGSSSAVFC